MTKRTGFSLMELTIATLLFSFISVSLSTIYSSASKHVFQNYRGNTIKLNLNLSMRAIRNVMTQATRISEPAPNARGTRLLVVMNMDGQSGCRPVAPAAAAASWHLFCTQNNAGNIRLFYHTGPVGAACPCPGVCSTAVPAPAGCPTNGMLLAQFLNTDTVFSRSWTFGDVPTNNRSVVKVSLRSIWNPASNMAGQRRVDFALFNHFSVNSSPH